MNEQHAQEGATCVFADAFTQRGETPWPSLPHEFTRSKFPCARMGTSFFRFQFIRLLPEVEAFVHGSGARHRRVSPQRQTTSGKRADTYAWSMARPLQHGCSTTSQERRFRLHTTASPIQQSAGSVACAPRLQHARRPAHGPSKGGGVFTLRPVPCIPFHPPYVASPKSFPNTPRMVETLSRQAPAEHIRGSGSSGGRPTSTGLP